MPGQQRLHFYSAERNAARQAATYDARSLSCARELIAHPELAAGCRGLIDWARAVVARLELEKGSDE